MGFIIETPNQCWHVACVGKTCFLAGYESRTTSLPHVFATKAEADGVLLSVREADGSPERSGKLRVVGVANG